MFEAVANACLAQVPLDTVKILLSGASLGLAATIILLLKYHAFSAKQKIGLIYSHLAALVFPGVLLTTNMACGFLCLPCFENPLALGLLALPGTLLLAGVAGFVVIPGYFLLSRRHAPLSGALASFVREQAGKLGMRSPRLLLLDRAQPLAFSFRAAATAIVLSVGLLDVLSRKEAEAVLLHELHHLKFRASLLKLSTHLLKLSPFSFLMGFQGDLGREEARADHFAAAVQGTGKHVQSAKRKIAMFSAGQPGWSEPSGQSSPRLGRYSHIEPSGQSTRRQTGQKC